MSLYALHLLGCANVCVSLIFQPFEKIRIYKSMMINTHIKKKFFLTVQSPLKNIKEMMDLEIHHLATIFEI